MENLIKKAAKDLAKSNKVVALTGAGVSVESGIPPFRGKGGIWEKIDPMEFAHIDSFMRDPAKVWNILIREMKDVIENAKPNSAHKGLARLEELGILNSIITQNVDGLHQLAGNTDVIEFHGTFALQRCLKCEKKIETSKVSLKEIPPKCECGGILRPDCVFFGEMIPQKHLFRSKKISQECDIMLVVGTSAVVYPASNIPIDAKNSGAKIIEINPENTPLTGSISDYIIRGNAGEVIKKIVSEVELLL
ncbi:MAG: NAD-dependent deacylase [Proteobacteria bacterium]|nr:NAD-dependent deacylase [Pseudomonadota bacterium]MBU4010804.1 NAD-dependent deacylase [Pseudomonadota bacterium]